MAVFALVFAGPCLLFAADESTIGIWALGREGVAWNFDDYLEGLQPLCDELISLLQDPYPEHPVPRP